jgi:hypothetical protein
MQFSAIEGFVGLLALGTGCGAGSGHGADDDGANRTTSGLASVSGSARAFRVFWPLGAQVEALAAPTAADRGAMAFLKARVNGYHLVLLEGGVLTYWATRPLYCTINFKNLALADARDPSGAPHTVTLDGRAYSAADVDRCQSEKDAADTEAWRAAGSHESRNAFVEALYLGAVERAIANLGLREEQRAGRTLSGSTLVRATDFAYAPAPRDAIAVERLPTVFDFAGRRAGLSFDRVMMYQEPFWQADRGSLLRVPLVPGGSTELAPNGACGFCLPHNTRMVDMLGRAFERAGYPSPAIAINVRAWTARSADELALAARSAHFGGINFEGSARRADAIDATVAGLAWMLEHTSAPISFLIPAWTDGQPAHTNTEAQRDVAVLANLRSYVRSLNAALRASLGLGDRADPLCNDRIALVPGGYGAPLHPQTFPLERVGADGVVRRAGTIAGELAELAEVRREMCRVP